MISVVTLVNKPDMYEEMVVKTLSPEHFELHPIYNPTSATAGLNAGLNAAKNDLVIFCHQDVSFPPNWYELVTKQLKKIIYIGVVGTFGISLRRQNLGCIYNPRPLVRQKGRLPQQALTLDEHCLMFYKSSGLRFDESCPYFHVYGADICMSAHEKGLRNYVIYSLLNHLSRRGTRDATFDAAVKWFVNKWSGRTDIIDFRSNCFRVNLEDRTWNSYI